ncbi:MULTISPECIES: FecR family protein [Pedobacter]|jgi:transmembrane sensor|uniref:FecR family protein n=1 Tax=Pedobacter TaxID=84567 RepID=UPI002930B133|nr:MULTISPECIES: FecR family protein [Pedobacter]HWW42119.1 FecR family protein [Pedobacter sp.]
MFDKEFDIATLISLYQKGEIDINSMQRLETWLAADQANQNLFEELSQENKLQSKLAKFRTFDENLGWEKVRSGIPEISQNVQAVKRIPLWPRYFLAAAIAAIVVGAGLFYYKGTKNKESVNHAYVSDIAPGKVGATLTLANGKKISLGDARKGELANEAGTSILKTADGQVVYEMKGHSGTSDKINTLTTANGETYILTLPDKSKVWMNAASSLTYSTSLNQHGIRKVQLQGEAYFEIFKDKAHPFVVQTNKQEIEVLGTHFNVNSYNDEPGIETTLMEGSVKITSGRFQKILKPGEQAINKGNSMAVNHVDVQTVVDWKNGDFNLDKVNFKVAMRKIARWYDVEIIYDASITDDMETGGWVSRGSNLSSILKLIESSGLVHFKVEGRKVYVYK